MEASGLRREISIGDTDWGIWEATGVGDVTQEDCVGWEGPQEEHTSGEHSQLRGKRKRSPQERQKKEPECERSSRGEVPGHQGRSSWRGAGLQGGQGASCHQGRRARMDKPQWGEAEPRQEGPRVGTGAGMLGMCRDTFSYGRTEGQGWQGREGPEGGRLAYTGLRVCSMSHGILVIFF